MVRVRVFFVTASLFLVTALAGSPGSATEQTPYHPTPERYYESFDRTQFENPTQITNPWLPLTPGKQWIFEGSINEDGERLTQRIEFTVTDLVKVIDGVPSVVAWIVDYTDGEIVEKEVAFYAQAKDGTVWFMGEYPEAYEDGKLVEAPTWIAGIEDAKAGIAMWAEPREGTPTYSQGWGPAVGWTDRAQVHKTTQETCVPADCYKDVLIIDEYCLTEPGFKLKYYARGIGNVRVGWRGDEQGQETLELIKTTTLGPEEMAKIHAQALELEKSAYKVSKNVYGKTEPAKPMHTRLGQN